MSGYYLAPSLVVLRAEIDTRWPRRDHTSDGWIGDAAHQAQGSKSDHNPNERGSVDAIDVDKDGIDPYAVIAAFERHPSAHYWIYQRQIADRDDGWRRRPYTGTNPHDKHAHFSIRQSRTAEQDRRPWGLLEDDMSAADVWGTTWPGTDGKDYTASSWVRMGNIYAARAWQEAQAARAELAALRTVVQTLADAVKAGGGSVDTAAVLAGVDERLTALREQVADELAGRLAS